MAHREQLDFIGCVKDHLPEFFTGTKVLEIGSLDINGSVRSFFTDSDYTGVDVGEGPGVDLAIPGQLVGLPSRSLDVAISCECFEHNPFWVETMSNMFRMTRPGGLVIMTCASIGREEHGTTRTTPAHSPLTVGGGWEYYRNISEGDIRRVFPLDWWFDEYSVGTNWASMDTYFVGLIKGKGTSGRLTALSEALKDISNPWKSKRGAFVYTAAKFSGETGVRALRSLARIIGIGMRETSS